MKKITVFSVLIFFFTSCTDKTYVYYKYKQPKFSKKNYLYNIKQQKNIIEFKNNDSEGVIKFNNKKEKLLKNFSQKYIINNFNKTNSIKFQNTKYLLFNKKSNYLYNFKNKKYFNNDINNDWKEKIKFENYHEISFDNKKIMNLEKIKNTNEKIETNIEKINFIINFFTNLKMAIVNLFLTPFDNTIEKEYSTKNIYKKQNLNTEKEYFNFK